jgi:hypothetical protein
MAVGVMLKKRILGLSKATFLFHDHFLFIYAARIPARSRNVADSIPDEIIGFFKLT